jgi:sugar/nucleoside kinase (ribokinase family)
VLGAGDMFASSFLYALNLGLPTDQIQKYAHETTSKLIKSANEKI